MSTMLVPRRFCGPPESGNGGWTAGEIAGRVEGSAPERESFWPPIEVSLRMPPPLDTALPVLLDDGSATATHAGQPVAVALSVEAELMPVAPVAHDVAVAASPSFPGHETHPFPSCFVCGTGRAAGDGLRIFPGLVASVDPGGTRVAAPWTPHPALGDGSSGDSARTSLAIAWAALDCTGGWAGDFGARLMVLARMVARIDTLPVIGEPHVVMGEARGSEGRKTWAATTLYDADGRVVGVAEQLWIAVDPVAFGA